MEGSTCALEGRRYACLAYTGRPPSNPFRIGHLITCDTPDFDRAMFQLTWKPVISAIAFAFTAFDDDYVVERAIAGFRKCATLAGRFDLPEVFDYVVKSLSHATSLLAETDTKSTKFPVVTVDGQSLTVSPLSIKFGTNLRGQLAAVVLFLIANGNGNAIREGWILVRSSMIVIANAS